MCFHPPPSLYYFLSINVLPFFCQWVNHMLAQAGLDLTEIQLSAPPKCRDKRREQPPLALLVCFFFFVCFFLHITKSSPEAFLSLETVFLWGTAVMKLDL